MLNVVVRVFGNAAAGVNNSHVGKNANQFVYSMFYGKRIAVYADCKNRKFGMSELVRSMVSGDTVQIEFKGQTPFSALLYCKLLIASNATPDVGTENADLSRLILVDVAPSLNRDDPEWPVRLEAELPQFLWACRKEYERLCPKHGNIKLSDTSEQRKMEVAAEFEEEFANAWEKYFISKPGAALAAKEMHRVLTQWAAMRDNQKAGDFKRWMDRTHGVKFRNSNGWRRYENVLLNEAVFGATCTSGSTAGRAA